MFPVDYVPSVAWLRHPSPSCHLGFISRADCGLLRSAFGVVAPPVPLSRWRVQRGSISEYPYRVAARGTCFHVDSVFVEHMFDGFFVLVLLYFQP